MITPCAHIYCRPCITQHIDAAPPPAACPLCRRPIKVNLLLEAAQDEEIDDGAGADAFQDIVIELSSTKVNAVLRALVSTVTLRFLTMSRKKMHPIIVKFKLGTVSI